MRTKELGLIVSNVGTMFWMESMHFYNSSWLYVGMAMMAVGVALVVYSKDR